MIKCSIMKKIKGNKLKRFFTNLENSFKNPIVQENKVSFEQMEHFCSQNLINGMPYVSGDLQEL